eukprot:1801958-Rhodomonas_salina.3
MALDGLIVEPLTHKTFVAVVLVTVIWDTGDRVRSVWYHCYGNTENDSPRNSSNPQLAAEALHGERVVTSFEHLTG